MVTSLKKKILIYPKYKSAGGISLKKENLIFSFIKALIMQHPLNRKPYKYSYLQNNHLENKNGYRKTKTDNRTDLRIKRRV